ncbi:hypothetical protein OROMI_009013 [Orobanche minor]
MAGVVRILPTMMGGDLLTLVRRRHHRSEERYLRSCPDNSANPNNDKSYQVRKRDASTSLVGGAIPPILPHPMIAQPNPTTVIPAGVGKVISLEEAQARPPHIARRLDGRKFNC